MNLDALRERGENLRVALLDGDASTMDREEPLFMGEIANALLQQNKEAMLLLRGYAGEYAILADEFASGAKPGDRWRALWSLLMACSEAVRPLEQYRLASPAQLSGVVLAIINGLPGITAGDLSKRTNKTAPHISNVLKQLQSEALVFMVPDQDDRRRSRYFISSKGKDVIVAFGPAVRVAQPVAGHGEMQREYPHLRQDRMRRKNQNTLPGRI